MMHYNNSYKHSECFYQTKNSRQSAWEESPPLAQAITQENTKFHVCAHMNIKLKFALSLRYKF